MKDLGEILIKISSIDGLEFLFWLSVIGVICFLMFISFQAGKLKSLEEDIKLQRFNELEEENRILKESIVIKKQIRSDLNDKF